MLAESDYDQRPQESFPFDQSEDVDPRCETMLLTAAALLLTLVVGLSLGVLGSGGSIVMLPVLVYVAAIEPASAVGMSLAIVGATSAGAAALKYRLGHVHLRATALFSLSGVIGAFLGSRLTHLVGQRVLMLLFAGVMIAVAVAMLRHAEGVGEERECRQVRCMLIGATIGVLTGFLGVGGGFLLVPALVLFAGIATKRAVGTSLAIISFNAASGFAGHVRYSDLDWRGTAMFLAVALLGMLLGMAISSKFGETRLTHVFAYFVLVVATVIAATEIYHLVSDPVSFIRKAEATWYHSSNISVTSVSGWSCA